MKILGLDLGLVNTGWYHMSEVSTGGLITPKNMNGVHRLEFLHEQLETLLWSLQPEIAMVEGYSFGSRAGHAFNIGEWGGLARWKLQREGVRTITVPPSSLKQFVTGKGNTQKEDVKLWTFKRWNMEFKTSDECDAYVLARMGYALWTMKDDDLTAVQIKALSKVEVYYEGTPVEVTARAR